MHHYSVFGGRLRSEIPFPELATASEASPDWTFRVAPEGAAASHVSDEFLGEDGIIGPVRARMYRRVDGSLRLGYSHWNVGSFLIAPDGNEIVWYSDRDPIVDAARLCMLGRVLAAAMHLQGTLCLHGSCVALEEGAVAFIAPKLHGKSTLATALVQAGARLATDDVLPVDLGSPVKVRPGVHRLRLWRDSAVSLGNFENQLARNDDNKIYLDMFGDAQLMHGPEPLQAIYLLSPRRDDSAADAAARQPVDPVQSIVKVLANASLGPLLDRSSQALFERSARLTERVPVYILQIVRDFGRLPEVVETILEWHGGPPRHPDTQAGGAGVVAAQGTEGSRLIRP